jgi:hypothetical protein
VLRLTATALSRFDTFADPSANDCYVRIPSVGGTDQECLLRAESAPTRVAGRTGVRAKAVIKRPSVPFRLRCKATGLEAAVA